MKLTRRVIPLGRGVKQAEIIFGGCLHVGHIGCNEDSIEAMVRYVASEPNRFLVLLGDAIDAINPADKRWNPRECATWVTTFQLSDICAEQARRAFKILREIPKERFLGMIEGNHERKVRSVNYHDVHRQLCESLGVESLDTQAFLQIQFKGRDSGTAEPVTIYLEHGSGGAGSPEAVLTKLKKQATKHPNADAYVGSHHHKAAFSTHTTAGLKKGSLEIEHVEVPVVTAGCHLSYYEKGTETYGSIYGMPVPSIGPAKLVVHPWGSPYLSPKIRGSVSRVTYRYPWWA